MPCHQASYAKAQRDRSAHHREPKPCAACGVTFTPSFGHRALRYCTKACERRVSYSKRNAMRKDAVIELVDPFKVFDRDGWLCSYCHCDTPRSKRGTKAPDAPELDHIVPISRGGTHCYANVQTACHECNRLKSDQHVDDWLPIREAMQCAAFI